MESDILFTINEQNAIADAFEAAGTATEFVPLASLEGHDAFLVDIEPFAAAIGTVPADSLIDPRLDRGARKAPRLRLTTIYRAGASNGGSGQWSTAQMVRSSSPSARVKRPSCATQAASAAMSGFFAVARSSSSSRKESNKAFGQSPTGA